MWMLRYFKSHGLGAVSSLWLSAKLVERERTKQAKQQKQNKLVLTRTKRKVASLVIFVVVAYATLHFGRRHKLNLKMCQKICLAARAKIRVLLFYLYGMNTLDTCQKMKWIDNIVFIWRHCNTESKRERENIKCLFHFHLHLLLLPRIARNAQQQQMHTCIRTHPAATTKTPMSHKNESNAKGKRQLQREQQLRQQQNLPQRRYHA